MNWLAWLGLDERLRRCRETASELVAAAEDRAELIRLEWAEEKQRLQHLLVLSVALAALTIVVMVVASVAVVVHFWDSGSRALVAWLVAAVWLLLWLGAAALLVQALRQGRQSFALTREELAADWSEMKERL